MKLLSYLEGEHECSVPLIHIIPRAATKPCYQSPITCVPGDCCFHLGVGEPRASGWEVFSDGDLGRPTGFQFCLGEKQSPWVFLSAGMEQK